MVMATTKAGPAAGIQHAVLLEMMEVAQQLGPRLIKELDGFLAVAIVAASAG